MGLGFTGLGLGVYGLGSRGLGFTVLGFRFSGFAASTHRLHLQGFGFFSTRIVLLYLFWVAVRELKLSYHNGYL